MERRRACLLSEYGARRRSQFGERADGGILGELFRIGDEVAFGYNTKATENLRDLFKDWIGLITPILEPTRDAVVGLGPYVVSIKEACEATRDYTNDIDQQIIGGGLKSLTVNVSPQGLTTAEAARQLGNQIAQNLTGQLVPAS